MEDDVFPSPAVAELLENRYVEARLHTDHAEKGEAQRALQMAYVGRVAAPYYVIVDPKTRLRLDEYKLGSTNVETIRAEIHAFLERNLQQ